MEKRNKIFKNEEKLIKKLLIVYKNAEEKNF